MHFFHFFEGLEEGFEERFVRGHQTSYNKHSIEYARSPEFAWPMHMAITFELVVHGK